MSKMLDEFTIEVGEHEAFCTIYDSTLRSAYINLHESYTKQNKLDSWIKRFVLCQ